MKQIYKYEVRKDRHETASAVDMFVLLLLTFDSFLYLQLMLMRDWIMGKQSKPSRLNELAL